MNDTPSPTAEVIDLAALTKPAQRVVGIFDRLERGEAPSPGTLDDALEALDQAPRPTGQLGHDIAVLVSGGDGHTKDEVVAAVDRLRRVATFKSKPADTARSTRHPRRKRPKQKPRSGQLRLPGLDDDRKDAS